MAWIARVCVLEAVRHADCLPAKCTNNRIQDPQCDPAFRSWTELFVSRPSHTNLAMQRRCLLLRRLCTVPSDSPFACAAWHSLCSDLPKRACAIVFLCLRMQRAEDILAVCTFEKKKFMCVTTEQLATSANYRIAFLIAKQNLVTHALLDT